MSDNIERHTIAVLVDNERMTSSIESFLFSQPFFAEASEKVGAATGRDFVFICYLLISLMPSRTRPPSTAANPPDRPPASRAAANQKASFAAVLRASSAAALA